MKSVYIAGPITADTPEKEQENIKKGIRAAKHFSRQGWAVYCPHALTYEGENLTYEYWLENDLHWISKCDAVAFIPGWENSRGACIEHMAAKGWGKEIIYLSERLFIQSRFSFEEEIS